MILEQLDARGRVVHRFRLDPAVTTVGRGYDNQVILDDPYVDPHHLRIAPGADGRLEYTDLGTTNGTWDQGLRWQVRSGVIRPGMELRVGRTVLRFGGFDQPVAPAVPDPALVGGLEHHLLDPRIAAALILLALAAAGVDAYFGSSGEFSLIQFLTPGLAALLAGSLWAGGWAFANRLVTHRFRFLPHLAWAALVGTVLLAVRIGAEWIDFFLPGAEAGWLALAADLAILTGLLAGHLWLVTEWDRWRRWRVAAVVTLALAAILALLETDQLPGGARRVLGSEMLKPVNGRLVPARTTDEFFRRAKSLKAEVDELTAEE